MKTIRIEGDSRISRGGVIFVIDWIGGPGNAAIERDVRPRIGGFVYSASGTQTQLVVICAADLVERVRQRPHEPVEGDKLAERELAAVDQHAADRFVRVSVLVRIADANDAAVVDADAPRALDLQEERVDRILDVDERFPVERRPPALDLCARPVRHDLASLHAAAHTLALELRVELGEVDGEEIVRHGVDRHAEALVARAAAREQRLVVAGDRSLGAAVGGTRTPLAERPRSRASASMGVPGRT